MRYIRTFNENMDLAKSILNKKMQDFEKLKSLLSKNLGYIGKFTEYLINENIPYSDLENLYKDLLFLKNKQNPLDITSMKYEDTIDKIQEYKNKISVSYVINMFPREQKDIAKKLLSDNYYYYDNLFLKISQKENIDAFISKISRYKDSYQLVNAMKIFSKDSFNDREEVIKYVTSSSNSEISYQNKDILIVRVKKIEDIQKLGSDTSWCILGNTMWNSYTKNRYQFILYDYTTDVYDPKFKIGFTLNNNLTIHAAHDILDKSCIDELKDIINRYGELSFSNLIVPIKIDDSIINKINKNTSSDKLTEIMNNCSIEQIKMMLNRILSIHNINNTTEFGSLSLKWTNIIFNLIIQYFNDYVFISKDDFVKLDSRFSKIDMNIIPMPNKLRSKYFNGKNLDISILPENVFISLLDKCSDHSIINGLHYDVLSLIIRKNGEFIWKKENVNKFSDRLNEIYKKMTDDETKFWGSNFKISTKTYLINAVASLNCLLNRTQLVSDKDFELVSTNTLAKYSNIFKKPIDLSKLTITSDLSKNEDIYDMIIKKDYDDDYRYINRYNVDFYSKLIQKLNNYKFKCYVERDVLKSCKTKGPTDYKFNNKLLDTIIKFNMNSKTGDVVNSDDGKLTLKLKY